MTATKDQYFGHKAISRSDLIDFRTAPAYYKFLKDYPSERTATKATLTGSAAHYLNFEKENFGKYMVVLDEAKRPHPDKNYTNKENQKWRADFNAEAESKKIEVISSDEYGVALDMHNAILKNKRASELMFAPGNVFEKMIVWTVDGIEFKCKLDVWNPEFIVDFKTAADAAPGKFERTVFSDGLDFQGGMYADGDRRNDKSMFFKPYFIVVQEKTAPYMVSIHQLSDEVLEYNAALYLDEAKKLDQCRRDNVWPGYEYHYKDVNNIFLPSYLKK